MDGKVPPPYSSVFPPASGPPMEGPYYPAQPMSMPMPMPQPNYGPPPSIPQGATNVIITSTPVSIPVLDTQPNRMTCPYCHAVIDTRVEKNPSTKAWLSSLAIAFFGSGCLCFLGCCLIPCCIDDCMDVKHSCPNCQAYLGERRA